MKRVVLWTLAALLALAGCGGQSGSDATVAAQRFTLTDQHGKPYTVPMAGTPAALYFGFTHCKDTCPATLRLLGKARAHAGLTAQQLPIVMVTVDPSRDTPAVLDAFVRRTGVDAVALTGKPRSLAGIYRSYGILVQRQKRDIAHTSSVYLIDAHGKLRRLVDAANPIDDVAKALRAVVD